MTIEQINTTIAQLREWEDLAAQAAAAVEEIKDTLKAELTARNTETLDTGTAIIRWTTTISNRFDTAGFKTAYGELYKAWTKPSPSRRFTVSK